MGTNVLLNQIPFKMGLVVCSCSVFECQSKIMNINWGCLDRRIPFWECQSLNQNKSELSEQLSLFSGGRKKRENVSNEPCHHGFITPRWSERSGVLYFKIKQSASAILFCFLFLFCLCCLFVLYCVFFWGVGITAY